MMEPMADQRGAAGAYRRQQGLIKSTGDGDSRDDGAPASHRQDRSRQPGGRDTASRDTASRGADRAPATGPAIPPGKSLRTVAQFLTLIGRQQAAAVLRNLPRDQADRIIDTMSRLDPISPTEARRILGTFGALRGEVSHEVAGGPDTAREILVRAFGPQEGERRFYELLPDQRPRRFSFLDDADGRQLSMVLRNESVATLAIVAANVSQETAARLVQALPEESRTAVIRRVAQIGSVDGTVLDAVEQTLRKRMESIERPAEDEVDGEERLAGILRYLDLSTSDTILEQLTASAPEAADHIRQQMTTLDDVLNLRDRDLQEVLKRVDDVDLAVVLKGKSSAIEERIMAGMSQRRGEMVSMQRESLGPMHRRDVDRVTSEFVELVRTMARAGEIVIQRTGEEYV